MDTSFFIQFLSVALFVVCFVHCWRTEGQRAAQQWFLIGFIFFLVIISLLVVISQIAYRNMLTIGAAPSLIVMLYPAIVYAAYRLAQRYVPVTDLWKMAYLTLAIVPWIALPLDTLALAAGWWFFPSESYSFLNGVPFYLPFAWALVAATFVAMMVRIRRIRFRGNGQFFAMILAAPLVAGLDIFLIGIVQVLVDFLVNVGGTGLAYGALVVLFALLPLAIFLNIPRLRSAAPPPQAPRPAKKRS